jgi:PAS domain S-box-containing protein
MQEIAARVPHDFYEQVRQILALGCRQFELPIGIMSRVGPAGLELVQTYGTPRLDRGDVIPLHRSYCAETLRDGKPLHVACAGSSPRWRDLPAYSSLGFETYIGAPLEVGGSTFGTLCFAGPEPRAKPFGETELELLRLMSQRIEIGLEHWHMEQNLRAVLEGTAATTGEDFHRSLVRHLAQALDVRYVFVTSCGDPSLTRARTLAFWSGDGFGENFEYDVAGTPCEAVLKRGSLLWHPDRLQHHYPDDRGLKRLGAESYVGLPMLDSGRSVVGHLAVMDVRPMPARRHRDWVLRIFAARAGAEIERKRVEAALQASEARFRTLVEQAPAIAYVAEPDEDSAATYVSPLIEDVTGYTQEEWCIAPSRWRAALHPDDRDEVLESLCRALRTDRPFVAEYRLHTRAGETIWIQDHGRLVRDGGRKGLFFQGVMIDVTERKRIERKLLESQKLESLGLLAGGIAHDFNNLLTSVLGNATLALRALPEDEPARKQIERMRVAAERAADLTRQMLAYSGRNRLVARPVDLNALVTEMAELLESAISKKAVLIRELADGLPAVEADATQIRQVVLNLITNASEALDDRGGTIRVVTGTASGAEVAAADWSGPGAPHAERYVALEVRDDGVGMDPETRRRMFDPFFSTKFAGRGLGLAAALGIVRGHHGAIRVESEPGRGTGVRLLFPATAHRPDVEPASAPVPDGWRGRGVVLVVDDEDGVRQVARHALESAGFEVLEAENGEAGLRRFRERAAEIVAVLLDLTMPRMDGEETLDALRRLGAEVPVVLMTGYSERHAAGRFAGKDVAGFLHKPYTLDELVNALRLCLDDGR